MSTARPAGRGRLVVALGGNALITRHQPPDAAPQLRNVERAVAALAPLARDHDLIITHGNGPQVGLLALESSSDPALAVPYPLDALGAETQGLIGYWLAQAVGNALTGHEVVAIVTRTLVAADDPAFTHPTKFIGAVYGEPVARDLAATRGWTVAPDGAGWRRVVASPEPVGVVEMALIRRLVDGGTVVVCGGGGGIPVADDGTGRLRGVEAVIDKDLTSAFIAEALGADALLLLTDVDAVISGFGTPAAVPIHRSTPAALRDQDFPAGSMGPKVNAACRFVERTGAMAAIGALADAQAIVAGNAGTTVTQSGDYYPAAVTAASGT